MSERFLALADEIEQALKDQGWLIDKNRTITADHRHLIDGVAFRDVRLSQGTRVDFLLTIEGAAIAVVEVKQIRGNKITRKLVNDALQQLKTYGNLIGQSGILPIWQNPFSSGSLPFMYAVIGNQYFFLNFVNPKPSFKLVKEFHRPDELLQILRRSSESLALLTESPRQVARDVEKPIAKEPEGEFFSFQIHIFGAATNSRDFSTVISLVTEVHTKCWLFVQHRYEDIVNYSETGNVSFENEANLIIYKIRKGSWEIELIQYIPTILPLIGAGLIGLGSLVSFVLEKIKLTADYSLLQAQVPQAKTQTRLFEAQVPQAEAQTSASLEQAKLFKAQTEQTQKATIYQEKMNDKALKAADYDLAAKAIEVFNSLDDFQQKNPEFAEYIVADLLGPQQTTYSLFQSSGTQIAVAVKGPTPRTRKRLPAVSKKLPGSNQQQPKLPLQPDFEPLRQWLQENFKGKRLVAVPFNQIEQIIDIPLPHQAKQTPHGWQDPVSDKSLVPGFKVIEVNPDTQTVIFEPKTD